MTNDYKIKDLLQTLSDSQDQRFGDKFMAYLVEGEMFALEHLGTRPLQLDIRCDRLLASKLQEEYESVMPSKDLTPRLWTTILVTGQLEHDFIQDLLRQAVVQAQTNPA